MNAPRCSSCFRRLDVAHRALGRCPGIVEPRPKQRRRSQRGYVPPSRANRQPRDEYLDAVRAPHGTRACYKRGCRQAECKAANAAYKRGRKRAA